jgi:putative membrane protein
MVLRRTPRLLLAASALFFGAAYFTARFPDTPGAGIGSFVSTLIIAVPSFVALWRYLGPKRAAVSLLALSILGFAIEMTGVVTGFPYGAFYYGDSLGPKVAGLVPYLLPLSWVPLVLGAVAASSPSKFGSRESGVEQGKEPENEGRAGERDDNREPPAKNPYSPLPTPYSPERSDEGAKRLLSAALLLTLLDGVLDPGAAFLGFWIWPEGGVYYGVPVTNYLGWLFSSSLAAALLIILGRYRWGSAPPPPGLLDSAIVAVAFWTGVAVIGGLLLPAALGVGLYFFLLARRSRLAAVAGSKYGYKSGGDGGRWRLVT